MNRTSFYAICVIAAATLGAVDVAGQRVGRTVETTRRTPATSRPYEAWERARFGEMGQSAAERLGEFFRREIPNSQPLIIDVLPAPYWGRLASDRQLIH